MSAKTFEIEYGSSSIEDLDKLPTFERNRILKKIERLRSGLHGNNKRLHEADYTYRLRMGDYRVLFDVERDVIIIRRVGHRKDIYE